MAAYVAEEWKVFYLHLATALEHLVKSVLADAHPSLIADTSKDFDSLLHLAGLGQRARKTSAAVRTVGVVEAVRRAGYLVDGLGPTPPGATVLLEARNGVVHLGRTDRVEGEDEILGDVARFVRRLLEARGVEPAAYWGEWDDLVAEHERRRLDALEATYKRRLLAAKQQYGILVEEMDDVTIARFVAALEPQGFGEDLQSVPVACPACDHMGELVGDSSPVWEADYDEDGPSGVYLDAIQFDGASFSCRICRLNLVGELLRPAGLASVTVGDAEQDLEDAYEYFSRLEAEDAREYDD